MLETEHRALRVASQPEFQSCLGRSQTAEWLDEASFCAQVLSQAGDDYTACSDALLIVLRQHGNPDGALAKFTALLAGGQGRFPPLCRAHDQHNMTLPDVA